MQFETREEVSDLKYVGKGTYGSVYQKEDKAIKIYHDILYKYSMPNPCLKLHKEKFHRLMKRNSQVKNTNLVENLVFIQDRFAGVSYPFFEGKTLDCNVSLLEKEIICNQLIQNASELTHYRIYPLDYKENNILYNEDCDVQIIDLDDIFTKVTLCPNLFYLMASIYSLKNTIVFFLENNFEHDFSFPLERYKESLKMRKKIFTSYQSLEEYVKNRCTEISAVFVPINSYEDIHSLNLTFLKDLLDQTNAKMILTTDYKEYDLECFYKKIICCLQDYGFPTYDVITSFDYGKEQFFNYLKNQGIEQFFMFHYASLTGEVQTHQICEEDDVSRYVKVFSNSSLKIVNNQ